jgi:hypothetical protein
MEETNEQIDWDTLISLAQQLVDLGTSIKESEATSDVTK